MYLICDRYDVNGTALGKFALSAWMISYIDPTELCGVAPSLGDFRNILSPSGAEGGADVTMMA